MDGKSAGGYNLRSARGFKLRWLLAFGDVGVRVLKPINFVLRLNVLCMSRFTGLYLMEIYASKDPYFLRRAKALKRVAIKRSPVVWLPVKDLSFGIIIVEDLF